MYFLCNNQNEKIHISCEIDPKGFFYQNSALQAACDPSIASVTGCVCPREGYRYGDYYSDYFEVYTSYLIIFFPSFLFFFCLSVVLFFFFLRVVCCAG